MKSGNYEESIIFYEQHLQEQPGDYMARNDMGYAYMETGNYDKALENFTRVLKSQPGNPNTIFNLGLLYLKMDQYDKTIETWQRYDDPTKPAANELVKKELTLVIIAHNQNLAKAAIVKEKRLAGSGKNLDPMTICVTSYDDLSPDNELRAFQKGLAAMVISDLSKIKKFKVVDRIRLQTLMNEMKLGQSGVVNAATAPKIGRLIGAGNVVVGSLSRGIQSTTTVLKSRHGKVVGSDVCVEPKENFFRLPGCIAQDIAMAKSVKFNKVQFRDGSNIHTMNLDAFLYFGSGLDAFDRSNWKQASLLFKKALKEDPMFGLALYWHNICPGGNSPSMAALSVMSPGDIAAHAEDVVGRATTALKSTVRAGDGLDDMSTGGGGGGGH